MVFEISRENARSTFSSLDSEIHSTFDYLDALRERGGELTGIASGFLELDKLTGGLQKSELTILAARPSMGKTAFALNVARHAAAANKTVAIFSLEMSAQALVLRLLSSEGRVEASVFRSGNFSAHSYQQLQQAASRLMQAPILIDDSGALSILEMKAKCRRLKSERGLDLAMVDYLQLMRGDTRVDSREQEIAEISRGLKAMAKELDIPVMALAQLNRGPEMREDKRPRLADLRESGAIEQDADVIAFLYRDEVYNPHDPQAQGTAELILQKQRNGPTGTVNLQFEARYTRFNDLSRREEGAGPPRGGPGFVPPDADDEGVPF
jgi:replicative DNA helicase